jgi:hypothetical protein
MKTITVEHQNVDVKLVLHKVGNATTGLHITLTDIKTGEEVAKYFVSAALRPEFGFLRSEFANTEMLTEEAK